MGLRTLGITASGLNAQLVSQANSSANTANAVTPAYSPSSIALSSHADGGVHAQALASARVSQGSLIITGNPLDLAIGGAGFFVLGDKKSLKVTRDGRMAIDDDGFLVSLDGERITPNIRFPAGAEGVQINRYGDVIARSTRGREFIGTIELATVSNPRGLLANGGSSLHLTPEAGTMVRAFPGEAGFGLLVQGGVEASNTDLSEEALNSIVAARAFSANARVLKLASKTSQELVDLVAKESKRKTKGQNTDIDLRRSQIADLVSLMSSGTSKLAGRPLSEELRAQLRARRLTPKDISREALSARGNLNERFAPVPVSEEVSSSFLAQEIRLARRRAFEIFQRRA